VSTRRWFVTFPEGKREALLKALCLSVEQPDAFTRAFAAEMIKVVDGALMVPDRRGLCTRRGFTTDHMGLAVLSAGFHYLNTDIHHRGGGLAAGWRTWALDSRRKIQKTLVPDTDNIVDAIATLDDDAIVSLDL